MKMIIVNYDTGLHICPNCNNVISFNSYFQAYYCNQCGYFDQDTIDIKRHYINAKEIGEIFDRVLNPSNSETDDK